MSSRPHGSRPRSVTIAVALLVMSGALGVIRSARHPSLDYAQTVSLGTYALGFLLARVIYQGRNWARWFCLVVIGVAVLGFASSSAEIQRLAVLPALEIVWFGFQSALCPAAVALLFLPASNQWFRHQGRAAS